MEKGFQAACSNNLPKIDVGMLIHFFNHTGLYTSVEIRGKKMERSSRDSYGDNAIGYVQVKRDGQKCIVKARVTPEHKVRKTPYHCMVECNEKDEIITNIECSDCVAHKGGCKHCIALVMWLHRRSEEPACTSEKCYWKKAKMSMIGSSIKFIKASDMYTGASSSDDKTEKRSTLSSEQKFFFENIVSSSRALNINSSLMNYHQVSNDEGSLSLHHLICDWQHNEENVCPDSFISYCKDYLKKNIKLIEIAERATTNQSHNNLWYELRYGRITASKVHDVAHCSTPDGSLVETIMGAYSFKETKAIQRGKNLEKAVLNSVEKTNNMKIEKSGLILNEDYPLHGASPDGVSDQFVIEVKCPIKNKNMKSYVSDDGTPQARYMAQLQLQMLFAKKEKALFCLAHEDFETTKKVDIYEISYKKEYVMDLIEQSMLFWKNNVFKKMLLN